MRLQGGDVPAMRQGACVVVGVDGNRLRIDLGARSVYANEVEVHLTPTEYDLLACLARNAGTVVSTSDIIAQVWGEWFGSVDHLFVHIHHLRRKLGACGGLIVTKRTVGYLLQAHHVEDKTAASKPALTGEYLELLQADAEERSVVWLIADDQRTITWVSSSVARLFGWWPSDLVGRNPWDVVHDDDVSDFMGRPTVTDGHAAQTFDTRARGSDGRSIDVTVTAQALVGQDGQQLGTIGEWRTRGGRASSTSCVPFRLSYDGELRLIRVEPHLPFLGWDPSLVIGTRFSLTGMDQQANQRILATLLDSGELETRMPLRLPCADGTSAAAHVSIRLHRQEGRMTGFTGEVRLLEA